MNQEIAGLALKFLERITLQPQEIEAYQVVVQELTGVVRGTQKSPNEGAGGVTQDD